MASRCLQGAFILCAGLLLFFAAQGIAQRNLLQTQQPQGFPLPSLESLPVDQDTKNLIQSAANDLFSAISYSSSDQQKIASTPKPQPGGNFPSGLSAIYGCMSPFSIQISLHGPAQSLGQQV
jgi:hypothetical protein